ncbi:hypothetical protein KCU99_g2719, partial [Aureobasidium melanogenum]
MDLASRLDDDVAPRPPEGVNVLPPHRTASNPLEHNLLTARETGAESSPEEARAFEPVDGLPELAVTALRRAGFEELLPSQKYVLESIKIRKDRRTNNNKVIASRFAAGKTTVLCLAGFVAIMRCSDDDSQPPSSEDTPLSTEISPAATSSEKSHNSMPSSAAAKPLVLMVSPFAEIAREAGAFLDLLLTFHGSSCATFAGEVLAEPDFTALSKWPTAVVGTFDRLFDLIELGRLNLSELVYLAIDDLDSCLKDGSFKSFLQVLSEKLPECQVIASCSSMTQDLVAPVLTLIKPNSPITAVVRMGRIPNSSLVTDGEIVSPSRTQEMTCLELLKELEDARQSHKKGQRIQQLETKEFGSVRRARFQEMLGEMKQDHEDDIPEDQVEFAWIRSRSHPARQQETRAARLNSLPADEVVAHKVQDTERHAMDRANAAPEQNAEASAYNPTYYDNMISAMTLEDRGGSNRKAVAATQRYRRKNKDNPEY